MITYNVINKYSELRQYFKQLKIWLWENLQFIKETISFITDRGGAEQITTDRYIELLENFLKTTIEFKWLGTYI